MTKKESSPNYKEWDGVLRFWFGQSGIGNVRNKSLWSSTDKGLDKTIKSEFEGLLNKAGNTELDHWIQSERSNLALVILTDQFPKHIYRHSPLLYAFDRKAEEACIRGLDAGHDDTFNDIEKWFFYLPLMHSENKDIQQLSTSYFSSLKNNADAKYRPIFEKTYQQAQLHTMIIQKFGRFPQRNALLNRISTPEEEAFLKLS